MSHRVHPTLGHPPQPQEQLTDEEQQTEQQTEQQQQTDQAKRPPAGEPDVENPCEIPPCEETTLSRPSRLSKSNTRRLSASGRVSARMSVVMDKLTVTEERGLYMGMRKSDADRKFVDAVINNDLSSLGVLSDKAPHLGVTKTKRFWMTLRAYPRHCLMTLSMCVIPILAGCIPIGIGALHASKMVDAFPDLSATYADMEMMSWARPPVSQYLEALVSFINNCGLYLMMTSVLCCIYDYKIVLPCIARSGLPFALLHVMIAPAASIARSKGIAISNGLLMMMLTACAFVFALASLRLLGRRVNDSTLWWKLFFFWLLPPGICFSLYQYLVLPSLSEMGDWSKLVLAAFVNPLLFEVVMMMTRMVTRSMPDHDESVAGIVPCAAMTIKKCVGRYVCYLILDPTVAILASVLLAAWEFASAAHVRMRDVFLYSIGMSSTEKAVKEAAIKRLMKHPRNVLMRTRNAHNETVLELCFSTTALILILAYRVSLDAKGLPPIGSLLQNFAVQITTELLVDLAIIMWLTVVVKQPVLSVSHKLFRGWTYMISVFVFYGNGFYLCSSVIEYTYAHVGEAGPDWFLLTAEVQDSLVNATYLCATYPSPANTLCS